MRLRSIMLRPAGSVRQPRLRTAVHLGLHVAGSCNGCGTKRDHRTMCHAFPKVSKRLISCFRILLAAFPQAATDALARCRQMGVENALTSLFRRYRKENLHEFVLCMGYTHSVSKLPSWKIHPGQRDECKAWNGMFTMLLPKCQCQCKEWWKSLHLFLKGRRLHI